MAGKCFMRKEIDNNFIHIDVFYDAIKSSHSHREVELVYVLTGKVNLIIENKSYAMNAGDVILINSGKEHSIMKFPFSDARSLIASIKISYSFLYSYMDGKMPKFWCYSGQDMEKYKYDQIRNVLDHMMKDYAVNKEKVRLIQLSDYYLLAHYLTNYFVVAESGDNKDGNSNRKEEIINYIERNYSQDLSLSDLAEYMGLSVSYLSRNMKKIFGMNFIDYVYDVRVEKAKELLIGSDKSITDVAYDTGFPNMASFNKYFRKRENMAPSEYRKKYEEYAKQELNDVTTTRAREALEDYLTITDKPDKFFDTHDTFDINADVSQFQEYMPIWKMGINVGSASQLLSADVQKSLIYAKKHIDFLGCRFCNVFAPEMYIVNSELKGSSRFSRLDRVLNFLLDNGIVPIIELAEKENRIERTINDYIKDYTNKSAFDNYDSFLKVIDEMMAHMVSMYSVTQVNTWVFEIWDDRRIEMYEDKKPYVQVYTDVRSIVKKYAPKARVGGAGNYLGWSKEHTSYALHLWLDKGVFPDFFTFSYVPYSVGEIQSERLSKRKSDEDDLKNTMLALRRSLLELGFPDKQIFLSSWNMTRSSRNYFNDSLWKACYIAKCTIDNIGLLDGMLYSQLQDSLTDYYDNQELLNGSAGLLSRDMIAKPAFLAFRLLNHLQRFLVEKGDNYIITRDEYGKITILIHNFINRNYLYFIKEENENNLKEHYSYFENQDAKEFHFQLEGMMNDCTYELHHHTVNREHGSIIDEWAKFDFNNNIHFDDIDYLKRITIPRIYSTFEDATDGKLEFSVTLEPLEVHCISIRPVK